MEHFLYILIGSLTGYMDYYLLCYTYESDSHSVKLALWVGVLSCGDTPVNVVRLLVSLRGRGARLWRHPG